MPARQIREVDRTWAQALFELARDRDQVEAIADEVDQLAELLREQPQLEGLLINPTLSHEEKAGLLERLFKGQVSDLLYRFLVVLSSKGRLAILPTVLGAFAERMVEHRGLVEVDLYVAQRLDAQQLEEVRQSISQILGKEAVLHQYLDEKLIGGLKLRIGDRLLDASVASQLKRLRKQLRKVGQERARGRGEVA